MKEYSLLSLLPPIIVLIFGYFTKRVILSLFLGIVSAALISSDYHIFDSIQLIVAYLWKNLELQTFFSTTNFLKTWNLFICIFLFILGIFVTLLQYSGGVYAYGNFVKKYIKNRKSAETSSLILSTLLFIDDYFSSLTVGSVMHPLTDSQKVPRAKLAFLVDSMAAPLAILCPFSSWVAAILGFLRENGISEAKNSETLVLASPLTTYFHIIPYIFYSFILIAGMWFIVRKSISFGLMKKHELIAMETGNLFGGGNPYKETINNNFDHHEENTSLIDFFTPVLILLLCIFSGMLFSGHWIYFGGNRGLIDALQHSSAAIALFTGGISALILCTGFFLTRNKIKLKQLPKIYWEGISLMTTAIIVLMLAWTLGDILRNDLYTGQYLANLMIGSVNIHFLPVILFVTATIIAFSIGSSWGTAAMVFPIAIPLAISMLNMDSTPTLEQAHILFPVLGAVLSGCVAGDHISLISDTTVMSATSSKSHHMDHFRTQLPYTIPIIIATGIAFLITAFLTSLGIWISILVSLGIGIAISILSLIMLDKFSNNT